MTEFSKTETFTKEQIDQRKKDIFDAMGKRSQKAILRKGYENWNPFEEPKDPIEIRKDRTGNTVNDIVDKFFKAFPHTKENNAYRKVVEDMALGVVTEDDRIKASYHFSMWYKKLMEDAGIKDDWV